MKSFIRRQSFWHSSHFCDGNINRTVKNSRLLCILCHSLWRWIVLEKSQDTVFSRSHCHSHNNIYSANRKKEAAERSVIISVRDLFVFLFLPVVRRSGSNDRFFIFVSRNLTEVDSFPLFWLLISKEETVILEFICELKKVDFTFKFSGNLESGTHSARVCWNWKAVKKAKTGPAVKSHGTR